MTTDFNKLTEQEQVELTAKVMGYELLWPSVDDLAPTIKATFEYWRPRTNSADAFLLAAKLEMSIKHSDADKSVTCYPRGRFDCAATIPHGGDKVASMRLAIFQASVQFGMSLPQ